MGDEDGGVTGHADLIITLLMRHIAPTRIYDTQLQGRISVYLLSWSLIFSLVTFYAF
jgi:hypothetical protein